LLHKKKRRPKLEEVEASPEEGNLTRRSQSLSRRRRPYSMKLKPHQKKATLLEEFEASSEEDDH
jgi:hypothetical protein